MKSNIITAILTVLLCVAIYFAFFDKNDSEKLEELENKNKELVVERDSILKERDSILTVKNKVSDSLRKEERNIKYVKYEKIVYANRTLDDALIILSNYKYNEGAEEDN